MKCSAHLIYSIFFLITLFFFFIQDHSVFVSDTEIQTKIALLHSTKYKKENAKVYGYDQKRKFVVLREGSNDMICLASDPTSDKLHVACYFAELEPFMARGRKLIEDGIT